MTLRWPRPRRRALLAAGGVLLALLLAVAAAEWAGWPFLRGPLERAASRAAGVPVAIGEEFRARLLLQPGLTTNRLRIGAADGINLPHLLQADAVNIGWRWRDLWRWRRDGEPLRLVRLHAGALDARLVRLADGRASWRLGRETAAPRDEDDGRGALPRIGSLIVGRGSITVDDAPLATRLQIALRGREGEDLAAAAAGYVARIEGHWRDVPLQLDVRTGGALPLLADLGDGGDSNAAIALRVEGRAGDARLLFDGSAAALLDARRLDGALRLSGPSLAAIGAPLRLTLPQTPAFDLDGRLAHDGGLWQLDARAAAIGRSRLAGRFSVDTRRRPALLAGRLEGRLLALADLGPSVGAATGGTPERPQTAAAPRRGERVLPNRRFNLPSLRGMDADVAVAIDELDFSTDAVAPLTALRTRLVLQQGVLELQSLDARVAGGRISGSTSLDANAAPARWGARLQLSGIDLDRWLPALRRGPRGAPYVTGTLAGRIDATGHGRSVAEILGSLDGQALLTLADGALSHLVTEAVGIDLAQALGVYVRGDRSLPLRCARFDLALADGVVRPRRAVVDNRDSTLAIAGSVDLGAERLALALRVTPKDFSPLALRTPITVTGPFSRPELGIDVGKLAGRTLGAIVLGAVVAPVAALLPLIDPGDRDRPDPCAATPGEPRR